MSDLNDHPQIPSSFDRDLWARPSWLCFSPLIKMLHHFSSFKADMTYGWMTRNDFRFFFYHRKQVYCLWLTLLIGGNWLNLLLNDFHELNIHSLFRSIENPLLLFDEQLPSIFLSLLRQHIGSSNVILTIKHTRQAKKEIFSIAIPKSNCINTRLLLAFTLLFKKSNFFSEVRSDFEGAIMSDRKMRNFYSNCQISWWMFLS